MISNVKIPNSEKIWVTYKNRNGEPKYVVTSKISDRSMYFLSSVEEGGKLKRILKNKNPIEFEKNIEWD